MPFDDQLFSLVHKWSLKSQLFRLHQYEFGTPLKGVPEFKILATDTVSKNRLNH